MSNLHELKFKALYIMSMKQSTRIHGNRLLQTCRIDAFPVSLSLSDNLLSCLPRPLLSLLHLTFSTALYPAFSCLVWSIHSSYIFFFLLFPPFPHRLLTFSFLLFTYSRIFPPCITFSHSLHPSSFMTYPLLTSSYIYKFY